MSKTVLLARPHPFIVSEMQPFLERNGYTPRRLDALNELPTVARGAVGAVVSLAISSSIDESPEAVLTNLRHCAPGLPVLFASLIELPRMQGKLERLMQSAGLAGSIVGVDSPQDAHAKLGNGGAFVYLGKRDLVSAERRPIALQLLQSHFR